jgi:Tfp pilus assembly protein PilV
MCDVNRRVRPVLRSTPNSFTLIEVVVAIAVIAFALISVLGLMTYGSQMAQQSDTYYRLSNVAGQVLAQYDSQPFSVSTNAATTNAVYFFTYEGLPTNSAGAYFQASATNADTAAWTLTNVMQVQIRICWPSPQFSNTNVIMTSSLNYD